MGCGNITPANSIRIQKNSIYHQIRIQKIKTKAKQKNQAGQKLQSKENRFQRSVPKKIIETFKNIVKNQVNSNSIKNTSSGQKNILKKNIPTSNDLSIKRRKNVKFKGFQPRFSVKVYNLQKTDESANLQKKINFDKENISPQKLHKKPRYLLNKFTQQKQEILPFINTSLRPTVFDNAQILDNDFEKVKTLDISSDYLPKVKNIKTQINQSQQKEQRKKQNQPKTIDYKKYLTLLKQKSQELKKQSTNNLKQRNSNIVIPKINFHREIRQTQPFDIGLQSRQNQAIDTPSIRVQKVRFIRQKALVSEYKQVQKKKWQEELQKQKNFYRNKNKYIQKPIYF